LREMPYMDMLYMCDVGWQPRCKGFFGEQVVSDAC
jgi:hypothetical protein